MAVSARIQRQFGQPFSGDLLGLFLCNLEIDGGFWKGFIKIVDDDEQGEDRHHQAEGDQAVVLGRQTF